MKKSSAWLLCFLTALVFAPGLDAQQASTAWKESEAAFSRELEQLKGMRDSSLTTLGKQYSDALSRLLDAKRKEGHLTAVLSIQDELKRYGENNAPPAKGVTLAVPEMEQYAETYRGNLWRIRGEAARRILQRADLFAQNLERMETQLTRANEIDEALTARQIKARILEHPDTLEARRDFDLAEAEKPAPPAVVPDAAPPAPVVKGEAGKDIFAIKQRWKEFYKCMANKDRAGAIACIDPEQVKTAGEAFLNVWLDILQAYVNAAEVWKAKPDTDRVDLNPDGINATAVHQLVFGNKEENLDPTTWVKRDGAWYIILKGK